LVECETSSTPCAIFGGSCEWNYCANIIELACPEGCVTNEEEV
jgi:hypothetical protein